MKSAAGSALPGRSGGGGPAGGPPPRGRGEGACSAWGPGSLIDARGGRGICGAGAVRAQVGGLSRTGRWAPWAMGLAVVRYSVSF